MKTCNTRLFFQCLQTKQMKLLSMVMVLTQGDNGSTNFYRQYFDLLWLFLSFMGLNLSIFVSFPYIHLTGYQLTAHLSQAAENILNKFQFPSWSTSHWGNWLKLGWPSKCFSATSVFTWQCVNFTRKKLFRKPQSDNKNWHIREKVTAWGHWGSKVS